MRSGNEMKTIKRRSGKDVGWICLRSGNEMKTIKPRSGKDVRDVDRRLANDLQTMKRSSDPLPTPRGCSVAILFIESKETNDEYRSRSARARTGEDPQKMQAISVGRRSTTEGRGSSTDDPQMISKPANEDPQM